MKIGVSGASGQLGASVLKFLKQRAPDAQLVGISRSRDKVSALGAEARLGDFDRPDALGAAYAGLDKLLIIPSNDMTPGKRAAQHTAAIEAAVAAGVGHIVFVGAVGVRAGKPLGIEESYFLPEQTLMRRAPQWTSLRMSYFAESFADEALGAIPGGVYAGTSSTPVNFVSREDVAAAAAAILATEGHYGAIYQATGPAALDGPARAAAIAKAAGKAIHFAEVPIDAYRQGLAGAGLPPHIVDVLLELKALWARGTFNLTTGDVEQLTGKAPRSLVDVLAARLG